MVLALFYGSGLGGVSSLLHKVEKLSQGATCTLVAPKDVIVKVPIARNKGTTLQVKRCIGYEQGAAFKGAVQIGVTREVKRLVTELLVFMLGQLDAGHACYYTMRLS